MSYQCQAPVGFFIFNRLETTIEVLDSIRKARPQKMYLVSDGPRDSKPNEKEKVDEVRRYVENHIDWPCDIEKNYSAHNLGCKKRMASGITWILENEESAIFLEDDVKPAADFFPFMEELLLRYKDEPRIMEVCGFKYLNDYPIERSYTFSHHSMIWGWGTWKRAWQYYDIDIKSWEQRKKDWSLRKHFNLWGYLISSRHFDSVYHHICDTWDYQWDYAIYEHDGLTIVPKVNMVENIGFGKGDATHTTGQSSYDFSVSNLTFPLEHPDRIMADSGYDERFVKEEWGTKTIIKKILGKI